ncbi:heparinase [Agrobacterium vitis]|uniref:Heparinase n=1 Tax=Agrobacterium vitis TaxID=373 RepID=A0ABD6GHQ9_AGRVI|nr:heparinase II/III family protein [Agrobacterium vitis]MUO79714.1 heparinase [Agrobacterium vitis]MUO96866.1 heparinase [Agrobacterium vitis]MUP07673.1 heparinase [Agrobacterium vitis]MUZ83643.1 heparinase [Agrobacterium vitis]MVA11866.1 heparinase [Agrobacterium vitis]
MPQRQGQSLPVLYVREGWRRWKRRGWLPVRAAFSRLHRRQVRLLVAPTDLRVVDSHVATEIFEGRFPLAGRLLECGRASPFTLELPSQVFAARLHSFSWLRHIRANKTPEASAHARAIVDSWIKLNGKRVGIGWEAGVLGQRIIAWLSHSPVVLQDCESSFYRRFLKSLSRQVAYAGLSADLAPDGVDRLRLRIALAMASIAMSASARQIRKAAHFLDLELERQVLADGGHISRNPQAALDILFDLLPLRQTYVNLGHDVPIKLISTIDRMFPAIRFFRHSNGDLALFNGATATLANDLMSVLRYDESGGQPFRALPHSHYQRLAAGGAVVLVDTGVPAKGDVSRTAHAGCLSFELSCGRHRLVVNSGTPRFAGERYRQMARATAAHSTLVIADQSSFRISTSRFLGPIIVGGVSSVEVMRRAGDDGSDHLTARHDGYLRGFGILHERDLRLNAAGTKLVGHDRLLSDKEQPLADMPKGGVIIRFHIHPSVRLTQEDDHNIRLTANGGSETWMFSSPTGFPVIAEDVFFAGLSGIQASEQIELVLETPEIWWFFSKQG